MTKRFFGKLCLLLATCFILVSGSLSAEDLFTQIADLIKSPDKFAGKFVSVSGHYSGWKNAPGSPPVSRSDWVLCDDAKNAIYCTGLIPQDSETGAPETFWKTITVLAQVKVANGKAFLQVAEIKAMAANSEKMVSVAQILFSPIEMQNQNVCLMGVLAKGYGVKGDRMYLLADPTGAIKLGRLPKLFPKGTILHVRGIIRNDENGLPMIDEVEIVSSRVN